MIKKMGNKFIPIKQENNNNHIIFSNIILCTRPPYYDFYFTFSMYLGPLPGINKNSKR